MDISAVNAATSAYGVNNKSSTVATTNQSFNVAQTTQTDSVSVSPEAIAAQRQEQYALKDNPTELFNDWLKTGLTFKDYSIGHGGTSKTLLPENQMIIDSLRVLQRQATTSEQKAGYDNKIEFVTVIGNKEIFNSIADIENRISAQNEYQALTGKYLTEKYGNPDGKLPDSFASHLRNKNGEMDFSRDSFLNSRPRLSSFIENNIIDNTIKSKHSPNLNQEVSSLNKHTSLTNLQSERFLTELMTKLNLK